MSAAASAPSDAYQLGAGGHRGTRAVQRLVEHAPASGSLALWMRHRDVDEPPSAARGLLSERERGRWLVGNDGTTIWYGTAFERLSLAEQTGLVAHQLLHVALRHAARERELRHVLGDVDGALFNLCADAIVNTALSHLDWLVLPADAVRLEELLARLLGEERSADAGLLRWDTESLYRAIDDRRPARGAASARGRRGTAGSDGPDGERGGERGGERDRERGGERGEGADETGRQARDGGGTVGAPESTPWREGAGGSDRADAAERRGGASAALNGDALVDGPIAAAARRLASATMRDLYAAPEDTPEREADEARRWSERLVRAHAADAAQSLLRQLLADRVTPRTPWERVLRTRLARSLAQAPELSWSRPTRSWLANRGRTANGRRLPWQPGTSGSRAAPRLCVVVDVSGSIGERVLARFAAELDRLMRVHRAEIHLIVGDERVRHEERLVPGCRARLAHGVEGGGGTNFVPLLEAAGARRPDVVVVLTDLDGPAGHRPPWPVIWALLPERATRPVPYGHAITLD